MANGISGLQIFIHHPKIEVQALRPPTREKEVVWIVNPDGCGDCGEVHPPAGLHCTTPSSFNFVDTAENQGQRRSQTRAREL